MKLTKQGAKGRERTRDRERQGRTQRDRERDTDRDIERDRDNKRERVQYLAVNRANYRQLMSVMRVGSIQML